MRLLKAEYSGALFVVLSAPNVSEVGLSGIVLLETKKTFLLMTPANLKKRTIANQA